MVRKENIASPNNFIQTEPVFVLRSIVLNDWNKEYINIRISINKLYKFGTFFFLISYDLRIWVTMHKYLYTFLFSWSSFIYENNKIKNYRCMIVICF